MFVEESKIPSNLKTHDRKTHTEIVVRNFTCSVWIIDNFESWFLWFKNSNHEHWANVHQNDVQYTNATCKRYTWDIDTLSCKRVWGEMNIHFVETTFCSTHRQIRKFTFGEMGYPTYANYLITLKFKQWITFKQQYIFYQFPRTEYFNFCFM